MLRERWELHGNELFRWKEEDGRWWRAHVSLDEAALLEQNRRVQAAGGSRKMDWGRMVLRFTEAQWHLLTKQFPGLIHGDRREQERILARISRDPDYQGNTIAKW
jgi:hypothetical protein